MVGLQSKVQTLPYFIAPLSPELQSRTLVAHLARGFVFHINTPASESALRAITALKHVLGLHNKLPSLKLDAAQRTPLDSQLRWNILRLIQHSWVRPLHELDMPWIDLQFQQLSHGEQYKAWDIIDRITSRSDSLPLTWRADQMKSVHATQIIPQDILSKLEMNLASLESSLLTKDPMMPQHLRNIHSLLISYPETVHLLEDDEIAKIIDAAQVHTKTEIVKATAKGTSASGSRKKINLDDL